MTHEIRLSGYTATLVTRESGKVPDGELYFGTAGSYGIEKIKLDLDSDWSELDILISFTANSGIISSGGTTTITYEKSTEVDVPPEATAQAGTGKLIFAGYSDGVRCISVDLNYHVDSHSSISGSESAQATPDIISQIYTIAQEAKALAEENGIAVATDDEVNEMLDELFVNNQ